VTPGRSARVSREPFDALGHATRRAIVEQLRDGPRSVAEITASTSISQPSVSRHLRQLAFAANTLTVVAAQLLILRRLAGHQRTTAVALAAAWAASWAMMTAAGHLGGGAAAVTAFAAAMVIFALGECLLSPTLPAIINDLAPPGAAGRYTGLGALAVTTGFLAGPAGGAALGAGFGTALFATLAAACAAAAAAARRMITAKRGVLLATASTNASAGYPYHADYNATKAGVLALCRTLALDSPRTSGPPASAPVT